MVINIPSALAMSGLLALNTLNTGILAQTPTTNLKPTQVLSEHVMPLSDRYPNPSVNEVFKENILLNLAYLGGSVKSKEDIDWQKIDEPNQFQITLEPGQTFVYHQGVLPGYLNDIIGKSHFSAQDGYKSDGYLYGDGVCHLASLFNWVATDAGLAVNAPTNHDFAPIPDIPKQNGTAIFYGPGADSTNSKENLYITNNKNTDVTFNVTYDSKNVDISVSQ